MTVGVEDISELSKAIRQDHLRNVSGELSLCDGCLDPFYVGYELGQRVHVFAQPVDHRRPHGIGDGRQDHLAHRADVVDLVCRHHATFSNSPTRSAGQACSVSVSIPAAVTIERCTDPPTVCTSRPPTGERERRMTSNKGTPWR